MWFSICVLIEKPKNKRHKRAELVAKVTNSLEKYKRPVDFWEIKEILPRRKLKRNGMWAVITPGGRWKDWLGDVEFKKVVSRYKEHTAVEVRCHI